MKIVCCPECKQSLSSNKAFCNCGWRAVEKQETDHACQYRVLGRRCKNAGTMCHAPYGNAWYCSSHFRVLGDARLCEAVLLESERHMKSA